ncbi:proline-specific permease [Colletotrichum truncatum]|uniref:Proline-specific permease n=1 Tax=Colletotrichum truncatum TaxID=5467 RepID=A0ACC3YYP4_COLTU|nr:proline-specific permease [Colletotrichum truncatum]KAF6782032.1 proline-specific permease [Colletotrichum truncatum]
MASINDKSPFPKESNAMDLANDQKTQDDGLCRLESNTFGESHLVSQGGTKRNVKSRHAQMIAIGGSIGTGLFVGSGQVLAVGGPAFLFISYALTSILVYGIVTAVMEVGTYLPVSGSSMSYYCARYTSRSLGFALGWLYFYSFGIILAYEIVVGSIIINYWPNNIHVSLWLTILIIVIVALNFSPVGVYAETEFWFASLKIILFIGLLIMSLVLILGGGPNGQRLGFYFWVDPGATKEYLVAGPGGRFTALLYCWVFSGFSFYFSPELIIITGGEMRNPRKNLPIASRRFFYRLIIFYLLGSLAIGAICSSNAEALTSGAGNADASPWVVAIKNAGISGLPSVVNAGILTSAWSAGNSYLYMSSRSLYSLAVAGNAPRIFARCNSYGLPTYAVLASSCFTVLAYLSVSSDAGVVFNWFVSLTNTAGYTSWILCAFIFLRFRKACDVQDIKPPYRSWCQPYGAWISMVCFAFLLFANGFTVFYPGRFSVSSFLTAYIGIPFFLVIFLGHKVIAGRNDPWVHAPEDVDLTSDLREVEAEAEWWTNTEEASKVGHQSKNWWRKLSLIWE